MTIVNIRKAGFLSRMFFRVFIFQGIVWAFIPAAPARAEEGQGCQMIRAASLPVTVDDNLILADVTINGRAVSLIVDTGSASTMLFDEAAQDLGLSVLRDDPVETPAIGGMLWAGNSKIRDFVLGSWLIHDLRVSVGGHGTRWKDKAVAGILGQDFLGQFDIEFDLAANRMAFYSPRQCEKAWLGYWSDKVVAVDFSRGGKRQTLIELPVDVNGKTLLAELRSGVGSTILSATAAANLGHPAQDPGTAAAAPLAGPGPKLLESWTSSFESFRLGDETIRNVTLRFADFASSAESHSTGSHIGRSALSYDLLLGADFIGAHHLLVSNSQNRLYFSYNGGRVFRGG